MVYADYEYYRKDYAGEKIPESLFLRCARQASAYMDRFTFGRIQEGHVLDVMRDCTCEMAECIYDLAVREEGRVKKSETTDGYSVTYVTEQADGADGNALLESKLYRICTLYLMGTGFMYRGVRPC